jgi:hypothetical protein
MFFWNWGDQSPSLARVHSLTATVEQPIITSQLAPRIGHRP